MNLGVPSEDPAQLLVADEEVLTPFPIVGIGASAGGVEAIQGLLKGVPAGSGIGFVIVTHLNPQRDSLLHEIVARYTTMTVRVAADGALVEPDCVHVMPSDAILSIESGRLRIRRADSERRERKPIDIFFCALAADQREFAVGIVLSGGDGDGALGIKAIKECGGLTLAQAADGFGPQHPDMPRSATATGMVDFSIPVGDMGNRLAAFARIMRQPLADRATPSVGSALEEAKQEIYLILRNQMSHDFSGYKEKTFIRRVQRRMQIQQLDTIGTYVDRLRQDPQEVTALFRDLLINVTNFFRDPAAFEALAGQVIPTLFANRGASDTIRLWIPGCSTGEEVYSLAILLREHMETLEVVPRVQIFATDIDEHALGVARTARYPAGLLNGVSAERKERFFVRDGAAFLLEKSVRELCIFSPHSITRDPPFSRIDLLSCRNLLIYLGSDVQNEVLPAFHYALRPGGILFLGTSENIGQFNDLFSAVDKKNRIFRSHADGSTSIRMPLAAGRLHGIGRASQSPLRTSAAGGIALGQSIESQVLDRFTPAHVVVNRDGDIVYFSSRTGKYLEPAAGQPTRQILTMARKDLRLDLHTLLCDAIEMNQMVRRQRLAVEGDDGRVQMVTLTIEPLRDRSDREPLFIVLFEDTGPTLSREQAFGHREPEDDNLVMQLERELRNTRERLQSMIEEYETAIEELKSSNEELVSVNEEVQSSNEELEASKEELQSLNEELQTINAELGIKIDALDQANGDLRNLFESTDLATVFLDEQLVIRSFTPAFGRIFNVLPGDRGRPITDLTSRLDLPGFASDLQSVLATGISIEHRIDHDAAGQHLLRLSAYRDPNATICGVVATFVDITSLAAAERRQSVLIAELQHRTRNLLAMVQAIAQQTLGKGGSMESYMHRLSALGRVQSLISEATANEVMLGDIVRLELQAHAADERQIRVHGPQVALRMEQVQTFALALHELATNAIKHGALRIPAGRLEISWTIQSVEDAARPNERLPDGVGPDHAARQLVLDWSESGVEINPSQLERWGYGRQLIERALGYALRAKTLFELRPNGVACRTIIPLKDRKG